MAACTVSSKGPSLEPDGGDRECGPREDDTSVREITKGLEKEAFNKSSLRFIITIIIVIIIRVDWKRTLMEYISDAFYTHLDSLYR